MPRTARLPSLTSYYHVIIRGNNKESIFQHDYQKTALLNLIYDQGQAGLIETTAYCVMNNHAHILIKADVSNLSEAIKAINLCYAMNYNHYMNRIGHVFQDRFKSHGVNDLQYLLGVVRYIHNNPVKAGIVQSPGNYRFSSYHEYLHDSRIITIAQKDFIIDCFAEKLKGFIEFHGRPDQSLFLDIGEEAKERRLNLARDMINAYLYEKQFDELSQILDIPMCRKELINEIRTRCGLTYGQISLLLGMSKTSIFRINNEK